MRPEVSIGFSLSVSIDVLLAFCASRSSVDVIFGLHNEHTLPRIPYAQQQ